MTVRYRPGAATDALLAVRGGIAVLVRDGDGPSTVDPETLWAALEGERAVTSVLEALTRGGLATAPPFAILDASGAAVRAFVRGPLAIEVERAGATESLDGAEVDTWRESVIPAFDRIRVGALSTETLPLTEGAVRATAFVIDTPTATEARTGPDVDVARSALPTAPIVPPPAGQPSTTDARADGRPAEQTLTDPPLADPPLFAETLTETPGETLSSDFSLFEETIVRSVEDAALIGDHDGLTIASSDIAGFADRQRPTASDRAPEPPRIRYVVETDRGVVEPLLAPVIVGRAPVASQVSSGAVPRLVVISDDPDLSRTHVRIALEGDTVVVTDLHSRNGTAIQMPGKPRQLLRAGEATPVLDGTVVDLGGTTLTVRSV